MRIQKLKKLELREIQGLGETLDDYAEYFKNEIARGACELWDINNGESFAITRIEFDEWTNKTALVVCCYKGKNLNDFAEHILKIADKNNWCIRVHTTNPALVRWYTRKYNFNEPEYVLTRDNKNG